MESSRTIEEKEEAFRKEIQLLEKKIAGLEYESQVAEEYLDTYEDTIGEYLKVVDSHKDD